jgi:hypothetical protein
VGEIDIGTAAQGDRIMSVGRFYETLLSHFVIGSAALAFVVVAIAIRHVIRGHVKNRKRHTVGFPAFLGTALLGCWILGQSGRWQFEHHVIYVVACCLLVPLVVCDHSKFRWKFVAAVFAVLLLQILFNRGVSPASSDLIVGLVMGLIPPVVITIFGVASDHVENRHHLREKTREKTALERHEDRRLAGRSGLPREVEVEPGEPIPESSRPRTLSPSGSCRSCFVDLRSIRQSIHTVQ